MSHTADRGSAKPLGLEVVRVSVVWVVELMVTKVEAMGALAVSAEAASEAVVRADAMVRVAMREVQQATREVVARGHQMLSS